MEHVMKKFDQVKEDNTPSQDESSQNKTKETPTNPPNVEQISSKPEIKETVVTVSTELPIVQNKTVENQSKSVQEHESESESDSQHSESDQSRSDQSESEYSSNTGSERRSSDESESENEKNDKNAASDRVTTSRGE